MTLGAADLDRMLPEICHIIAEKKAEKENA